MREDRSTEKGRPRRRRLALAGLAEAALLLGISKQALSERRRPSALAGGRVVFPEPVAELACGPIWLRAQLLEYARQLELGPAAAAEESAAAKQERLALLDQVLGGLSI